MGVMATKGLKRVLAMHEDDCISMMEKVFGRGCSSGSCVIVRFYLVSLKQFIPALKLSKNRTLKINFSKSNLGRERS